VFGLYAGIGQHQGGVGGGAEAYLVPGRLSLWVGAGIWPGQVGLVATAAAVRWYPAPAPPHRMFVDASWTLGVVTNTRRGSRTGRYYAPGVMLGYSYLAGSGFSVAAGVGLAGPAYDEVVPLLQLAVGWTLRR